MQLQRNQPLFAAVAATLLFCFLGVCSGQADTSKHVPGLDVTKANLNTTLAAMPADQHVLMEFYATWCPACRHFKPEYDKVAKFFNAQASAGASKIVALRLDCAIDPDVCGSYQVASYPSMFAGAAADFATVNVAKLEKFDYGKYTRNAKGVVKFVADTFGIDLTYVDVPEQQQQPAADATTPGKGVTNVPVEMKWTIPDVQLATIQLFESIAAQDILHSKDEQRTAFMQLLQVWEKTHPVPACKSGASNALQVLNDKWPAGKAATSADLKSIQICGECTSTTSCTGASNDAVAALAGQAQSKAPSSSSNELNWIACKGSKPEQRGYTCALWLLFHTTAARLEESDVALYMSSMKGFAHQFFQCEVCKRHFERLADAPEAAAATSQRAVVLWVWNAHNEVNERLAGIEKKYGHSSTGDAAYPKVQWPTKSKCPQCRLPTLEKKSDERGGSDGGRRTGESLGSDTEQVKWNDEEVYRFLMKWYGGEPGSGTVEDFLTAAGQAAQATDEGESLALDSEAAANSIALFSNAFNIAAVLAIAVVAFWLYGRSQKHRRAVHVKGPGSIHHHSVRSGPHLSVPRNGVVSGGVHHANSDVWRHGKKEVD